MQIKLLVRLAMAVLLVLAVAHCRPPREPLYTCDAGDPTCDFDSTKTSGKGNGKGKGDSKPTNLGARTPPGGPGGTPPGEEAEEEKSEEEETTDTDSNDDSDGSEPAQITPAQTDITVKLALLENNKDGVEFRLIYEPFDGVIHRDFSIGQGTDPVEHYPSTEFQDKLSLDLKIRVRAEYEHKGSVYCAHFDLSKAFSDYGDSAPALSEERECQ